MQDSERRQLDRSRVVREFTRTYTSAFPAGSRAANLIDDLDAVITLIETQAAKQDTAMLKRQESTDQKDAAIEALLELLRRNSLTARSIPDLSPGIAAEFKMPGNSDQAVLTRAAAHINAATPIAAEFTSRGLPATFLTDIQAAIETVSAAQQAQAAALVEQTGATAALAAALKQERDTVRQLDAIVRNQFRNDPAALAAWESASHIESGPKKTDDGEDDDGNNDNEPPAPPAP